MAYMALHDLAFLSLATFPRYCILRPWLNSFSLLYCVYPVLFHVNLLYLEVSLYLLQLHLINSLLALQHWASLSASSCLIWITLIFTPVDMATSSSQHLSSSINISPLSLDSGHWISRVLHLYYLQMPIRNKWINEPKKYFKCSKVLCIFSFTFNQA